MRKIFAMWLLITADSLVAAEKSSIDFNRDIRPILAENCFYCHGQDPQKRKADLRLDDRKAALEAGAIVPKDVRASQMIERILTDEPSKLMPPAKSNRRLAPEQKALLKRWVEEGADYANHWAFVAPLRPLLPIVQKKDWVRNPIDAFVLAKLEAEGIAPSTEADRATLIRRLSIDLVGLPPTPAEVEAFVQDRDPKAYENLVDRLLASPHYGERQALPWLDAARYADSNGFQQDGDTWQWIWRDWVVRALNEDLPFDQFTIWQLAGDLIPNATLDQKIASGFNRNHLLNGEGGAIAEEQRWVILFDRMETTATTWLALTMNCAQCHDHKYDPITMRDYYSLLDAFNRVPESGTPQFFSSRVRVASPFLELPTEANTNKIREFEKDISKLDLATKDVITKAFQDWRSGITMENKDLPEPIRVILGKSEKDRSEPERKSLESGLKKQFDEKVRASALSKVPEVGKLDQLRKQMDAYKNDQIPRVMVMSDAKPRETKILDRGEYLKPREKVTFATPAFLLPLPKDATPDRLGFARWLVSPEHPLTARVQVNRTWQHFFGQGIVKTAEDLGVQGEYPVHRPLLDWLAVEFREGGWSMKAIQRLIVTSATYRQASKVTPELRAKDPENRLYARASRFRMPSLLLRDWALASSGLLDGKMGGAPVYPYQPEAVWESLAITKERDFTYPASSGKELYRRSLYTFWRRTVGPSNMFDASNRQSCRVRASTTSTPLHALTTLNDPTWVEAARVLAELSMKSHHNLDARLTFAFSRVVSRLPRENDLKILCRAYERQAKIYYDDPKSAEEFLKIGASKRDEAFNVVEHAALTAVCLAIYNLDESLTRE